MTFKFICLFKEKNFSSKTRKTDTRMYYTQWIHSLFKKKHFNNFIFYKWRKCTHWKKNNSDYFWWRHTFYESNSYLYPNIGFTVIFHTLQNLVLQKAYLFLLPSFKLSCESRFQRAFTARVCVFKVIMLACANQGKYFENGNASSKRTLKTTVTTQL